MFLIIRLKFRSDPYILLGGGGGLTYAQGIAIGFSAGFAGSVAGQGAAAMMGLQKGIDLKSALITGLATAATAGAGHFLKGSTSYQKLTDT